MLHTRDVSVTRVSGCASARNGSEERGARGKRRGGVYHAPGSSGKVHSHYLVFSVSTRREHTGGSGRDIERPKLRHSTSRHADFFPKRGLVTVVLSERPLKREET